MSKHDESAKQHKEKMRQLHSLFQKKTAYHNQKAYLELKDIYWLVHEFFTTFMGKEIHFTEEELMHELANFRHEFVSLPHGLVQEWHAFCIKLSHNQYSGFEPTQEELKAMLAEFSRLVDETVGKEHAPQDSFASHVHAAQLFLKNGDVDKAQEAYKKLMAEYTGFEQEKKRTHYEELEQLYEAIAAAARSA